jgi:tetratricopeptide (TPR) repeat protein
VAAAILAASQLPAIAADLDDLPPEVREKAQPVHINWSKQLNQTLEGALHLKGVQLPGRPDGAAAMQVETVHLGAVQAPAELPLQAVGASALSEAVQSLLVGLLAQGTTSAEGWREQIETGGLTVPDICAIWRRFRREHPHEGERFGVASSLWAAIEVSIPPEQRHAADLPLDDAFSLGDIQLWGRDGEAAQQTFEALLARLPEGPTTGRVSRGLLAYRIAQCRKEALNLEGALDWFLKCAEWGTPDMTGGYDVRGEGYVEAARMCRRLGRDDEAQALYKQAINECGGWGQIVAASDLAHVLRRQGRTDEARALLERVAQQQEGNGGAAVLLNVLASWSYDEGQVSQTLDYCRRGREVVSRCTGPRAQDQVRAFERLEKRVAQWTRSPFEVPPPSLHLVGSPGSRATGGTFTVSTWQDPDLAIVSDLPAVEIRLSRTTSPVPGEATREYDVHLRRDARPGTYEGKVEVTGPEGASARIPVKLVVRHPVQAVPTQLFFGFVGPGGAASATLVLSADLPFRITRVDCADRAIQASHAEEVADRKHAITLACHPPAGSRGAQEVEIRVLTDLERDPVSLVARWHVLDRR